MLRAALLLAGAAAVSACSTAPPTRTVSHPRSPVTGASTTATAPRAGSGNYTVVRGDTLFSIAFRNQLDYHDLAAWNGIGRDYAIRAGQVLRLTPPGREALPADRGDVDTGPPAPLPKSASPAAVSANPASAATGPARSPATSASASASAARRADDGGWEWPTRGKVVRGFGDDPSAKGIDITGDRGQIVVASRGGKVVYSGSALKGYGELIIIKHDEQYLSAYGYNRRRLVEEGATVVAGQPIAEMGDGPEQRPLLHYEIREKGRPVDPKPLLPAR
jgi:lipoprotein NlpD